MMIAFQVESEEAEEEEGERAEEEAAVNLSDVLH